MEPLDDLLIKRRRGALVAAERRRLDSARRASPEYDLAVLAHDVFDRDGAARPGDAERVRDLVEAVERRLPRSPRARGRWRSILRRVAPPLFVAGAAAASIGELFAPKPAPPAAFPPTAPAPSGAAAARLPASEPRLPEPTLTPPESPLPPAPIPPPIAPPPEPRARRLGPERASAATPGKTPLVKASEPTRALGAPSRPAPPPESARDESAQDLFRRANRLRGSDWPAAAALYVELIQRHPSSNEAGVAEVALGKWSLAQGRSGDALEWFRAHQRRPPGALTAEALFGEARALESIGSQSEARAPWRRLLELYPSSPYAALARRRLEP